MKPRSDDALAAIVGKLALAIAMTVALVLPLGYHFVKYRDLTGYLTLMAAVKADSISSGLSSLYPESWTYRENRMSELLSAEPINLENESVSVRDASDRVLLRVGDAPAPPVLRRSHPVHDSGRVVGRVEVERSLRGVYLETAIAALLGLLLGGAVFVTLRVLPLRALRRVTGALVQNAARLEKTLNVLSESEESYRRLFEFSHDGMLIHTQGKIVLVNSMCLKLFGATCPEQLVGKPVIELFHPDHRDRVSESWQTSTEDRSAPGAECRVVTLERKVLEVELAALPFMYQGEPSIQVVMRDVSERKKAQERLSYLAQYDSLTDLANRGLFRDRLEFTLAHARRSGKAAAVLFIDLDRFKDVNDTLGHAIGDKLLLQFAKRLKACMRGDDTVGRFGGDEFGVILVDLAKAEDAALVAQKIVESLARPFDLDGNRIFVSASIGITLFPADAADAETLSMNADAAMYRAKELGRNGYQFFMPEMNERAMQRMQMEAAMRLALDQGEFVLYYQPKVAIASGAICGAEALLRWKHPQRGLVSPAEFIPVLEDSGLIVPVGQWVLREACRQIHAWRQAGLAVPPIAVNLSARQFEQKDLEQSIRGILEQAGVEPVLLQLEITESLLMGDPKGAERILRGLKEAGIGLSIDDFGTGYSSLAYLKRFPLDALKIDRAFVKDIVTDPDDAAIVLAMISLAHSLGLKVVAEGVEDEAQLNLLALHFCDELQGFYFSRPLPAAELATMLREGRRLMRSKDWASAKPAVLLLDDNETDLSLLKHALRSEDFEVLTASSAQKAFLLLATHPVGVVVADLRMPGMDGGEFLGKVRKLYPNALRVAISGSVETKTVASAVNEAGIHKFLSKNWDSERLRAEVREVYQRATAGFLPMAARETT